LVVASNGFQWKKIKKRGTEIVKFLPKIFLVVNTQSGRACVRTLQRQSNVWDGNESAVFLSNDGGFYRFPKPIKNYNTHFKAS